MYKLTIGSSQISYNLVIPAATKLRIWNLILVEILEMSSKIEDIWPLYVSWYFCHMIVYLQWNRYFLNKSRIVIFSLMLKSCWYLNSKYLFYVSLGKDRLCRRNDLLSKVKYFWNTREGIQSRKKMPGNFLTFLSIYNIERGSFK